MAFFDDVLPWQMAWLLDGGTGWLPDGMDFLHKCEFAGCIETI